MIQNILTKEAYNVALVKHLLSVGLLRMSDGHLVSSRKLIEQVAFFETEDIICREWVNGVYDSYYFYEGFETLEQCEQYIFNSIYNPVHFVIIEFSGMFYAVAYENTQNQQIIGKNQAYYTKNKLFLVSERPPLNLVIKQKTRLPVVTVIYHELLCFDSDLRAYHLENGSTSHFVPMETHKAIPYIVLLGVTFKDQWFPCHSPHAIAHSRAVLNMYFNEGHAFTLFGKYANAIAINPFQRLVCFSKGRVEHYQMDTDDRKTPFRKLPYREVKRFQHMYRIRDVQEHTHLLELI